MTPERRIEILERRLKLNNDNWIKAAKQALSGDTKSLSLQIELHEAEPVKIVLSDDN